MVSQPQDSRSGRKLLPVNLTELLVHYVSHYKLLVIQTNHFGLQYRIYKMSAYKKIQDIDESFAPLIGQNYKMLAIEQILHKQSCLSTTSVFIKDHPNVKFKISTKCKCH